MGSMASWSCLLNFCNTLSTSLSELPCIMNPQKFCAHGALQTPCRNRVARNGVATCILNGVSSAHTHAPLSHQTSLTNISSKLQVSRISGWWQQRIKPEMRVPVGVGPVWLHRSLTLKPALHVHFGNKITARKYDHIVLELPFVIALWIVFYPLLLFYFT